MVEKNLIHPVKFMQNGIKLAEFQKVHQNRYIEHLEKQVTELKLENAELNKLLKQRGNVNEQNFNDSETERSCITTMTGRPDIDVGSTMSFNIHAGKK